MPIRTPDLKILDKTLTDIGNRIDDLFDKSGPKWLDDFVGAKEYARDLANEITNLQSALTNLTPNTQAWQKQNETLKATQDLYKKVAAESSALNKSLNAGVAVIDKLGKGIISLGLNTFTTGMQQLSKAVYKVWDVMERATKVAGEFALQVGAASSNFKSAQKFGAAWEGTIRGMTDAQGMGMKMAADFIETFDRIPLDAKTKEGNRFAKMQVGMARGFNLGGEGAAELADTMRRLTGVLGDNEEEYKQMSDRQADFFKDGVAAAKAANVPINKFFKEISKASDFFLEVGESGRKGLTTAIGYIKKIGVSVKDLEKMTDKFDTFDETAKSVAKLNTVFGTTISSMEVMLEQDPGKRFEIIKKQLQGQGKAFGDLSRVEKKVIAETTGLSVKSIQGMLDSGLSLEEFEKRQEKAQEKKLKSEEMIRNAMQKTATTMFAFKAAWDQVFIAVSKLIKPFTDVLGLTQSGEKGAKSFSQVMDGLFKRLIKFIEEVAANKDWQGFMKRLAKDAVDLASKISAVATGPGLGEWIKNVVKAGSDFYDIMKSAFGIVVKVGKQAMPVVEFITNHIKEILALWAGSKIAGMGVGLMGMAGAAGAGGMAGKAIGGAAGVAGGVAAGYATGGGTTGGMIGGGIGGLLGVINPFLGVIGGAVGGWLGKHAERMLFPDALKDAEERRIKVDKEIAEITKERLAIEQKYNDTIESISKRRKQQETESGNTDKMIADLARQSKGKKSIEVDTEGQTKLLKRLEDVKETFGGAFSKEQQALFQKLSEASGPIKVTKKEMELLANASEGYNSVLKMGKDQIDKSIGGEIAKRKKESENRADANRDLNDADEEKTKKAKEQLKDIDKLSSKEVIEKATEGWSKWDSFWKKRLSPEEARTMLEKRYKSEAADAMNAMKNREKELAEFQKKKAEEVAAFQLLQTLKSGDAYQKFANKLRSGNPDLSESEIERQYGEGDSIESRQLRRVLKSLKGMGANVPERAAGGIAMSRQQAIVGEAGPEAIVPLKALVSGGDSLSANAIGAQVAGDIANLAQGRASSGGGGGSREVTIEVPIYLDSSVIGRAVSKSMLSDYEV